MREDRSLENVSKNYNTCWSTGSSTVLSAVSPSLTLFHSHSQKQLSYSRWDVRMLKSHCAKLIWLYLQEDHIGGCGMYRMYRQCLYY